MKRLAPCIKIFQFQLLGAVPAFGKSLAGFFQLFGHAFCLLRGQRILLRQQGVCPFQQAGNGLRALCYVNAKIHLADVSHCGFQTFYGNLALCRLACGSRKDADCLHAAVVGANDAVCAAAYESLIGKGQLQPVAVRIGSTDPARKPQLYLPFARFYGCKSHAFRKPLEGQLARPYEILLQVPGKCHVARQGGHNCVMEGSVFPFLNGILRILDAVVMELYLERLVPALGSDCPCKQPVLQFQGNIIPIVRNPMPPGLPFEA